MIQAAMGEHRPIAHIVPVADPLQPHTGGYVVDDLPVRIQDPRTSYMSPAMFELVKSACR